MTQAPDLLPGTLDLLILRTLQKDSLHGWAISERIQEISEDVLQIKSYGGARRRHSSREIRTSERPQYQVELGLQLCDPSELDAQLPFSNAEALVNRPP